MGARIIKKDIMIFEVNGIDYMSLLSFWVKCFRIWQKASKNFSL